MDTITKLKNCRSKIDLALLLNCKPSHLTYLLYKQSPSQKYTQFSVNKKNGGIRNISAPISQLKELQSNLSHLLLDCIDDINATKSMKSTLSHGFVREKSIITNAEMHKNTKNVLNIDLENFFASFNFGRVRGFFISNNNFLLNKDIATVIAQIACHNNELPQGSPCSPVITNLITHSLDIRLANLAKKYSCTYSRYADDITFSTRKTQFPKEIMCERENVFTPSRRLNGEIIRAGFKINPKKTRIQYKDSRQDVTGLIVNKKIGVKKEYRQITKSMCNSLFHSGGFTKLVDGKHEKGSIEELEGRLNFIDSIDLYNRLTFPEKLSIHYPHVKHGIKTKKLLTGRERTLSKFLFYKNFFANEKPKILCEGKTDNIYLMAALNNLSSNYPSLASPATATKLFEPLVSFLNYSKRTKFLLELAGGTSYLVGFILDYHKYYSFYKAEKSNNPVIIILDNDDGLGEVIKAIAKIKTCVVEAPVIAGQNINDQVKSSRFVHVCHNLYLVITPLDQGKDTMIENLFEPQLWATPIKGRTFDPTEKKKPTDNYYGKNIFATEVVNPKKGQINFDGFKPLFDRMVEVLEHYKVNRQP
ncbi:ribonuclease H [Aliivibrio fischeri]|uniref:retron Ec67 family RNA-directed DNA polymerase/endonuclease n=1 Tax=Aliivibrio fischeri TaxID=668 RepID=UPI0012D98ED7|nr:retron Ec67 family RNA-directed DNA polymerase/endonuclease [Aliivibrio fischeri]MUK78941.1 ribonuclease H [Aliivibrio fischeri]